MERRVSPTHSHHSLRRLGEASLWMPLSNASNLRTQASQLRAAIGRTFGEKVSRPMLSGHVNGVMVREASAWHAWEHSCDGRVVASCRSVTSRVITFRLEE